MPAMETVSKAVSNESIIFLFKTWRNELNKSCQNVENYAIFYVRLNFCELILYINKTLNYILQAFPCFLSKTATLQHVRGASRALYALQVISWTWQESEFPLHKKGFLFLSFSLPICEISILSFLIKDRRVKISFFFTVSRNTLV